MNTRPYELYISLDRLKKFWQLQTHWSNELPLRVALTSLELSFLLIHQTSQDTRVAARRSERIERLFLGCRQQIELLGQWLHPNLPPDEVLSDTPSAQTNLKELVCLDSTYRQGIKQWSNFYGIIADNFPCALGLEPHINALRNCDGFEAKLFIPYDTWIQPQAIATFFHKRDFNAEDGLFATVHQITECWLFLAIGGLRWGDRAAQQGQWSIATGWIDRARSILDYLSGHVLLLETMVLSDYHPLRVRLRDASGAQSAQVVELVGCAQRLLEPVEGYLQKRDCRWLDLYRHPETHKGIHHYLQALASLETRLSSFFFYHYKLAAQVLGTESLGSLGFEVQNLGASH
ncbi:hypothetical protein [Lusitaniella coriacea]|uniref:hypothetical protein n=1 Tax=Lusitaniella coriacea TaxID=1983105 RepID=UPI003CEB86D9